MARANLLEYLQNYAFWLFDVGPIDGTSIPIFAPLSAFSAISAPEIAVETQQVVEGNWYFTQKVFGRADVRTIKLSRGSTAANADFWRWMRSGFEGLSSLAGGLSIGGASPRREMVLVHFFAHSPIPLPTSLSALESLGAAELAATSLLTQGIGGALSGGGVSITAGLQGAAVAAGQVFLGEGASRRLGGGPGSSALRIPAKAWLLHGCFPTRYKPGSDFDATSSAISIQELDMSVDSMEEISLTA